jgi:hypothetical protein
MNYRHDRAYARNSSIYFKVIAAAGACRAQIARRAKSEIITAEDVFPRGRGADIRIGFAAPVADARRPG